MKISKQMIREARKIVLSNNNYSISFLQRKLQIGYNLAADIMEIIKKSGLMKITSL